MAPPPLSDVTVALESDMPVLDVLSVGVAAESILSSLLLEPASAGDVAELIASESTIPVLDVLSVGVTAESLPPSLLFEPTSADSSPAGCSEAKLNTANFDYLQDRWGFQQVRNYRLKKNACGEQSLRRRLHQNRST